MARINFSDNIEAKGRQLHLQTHLSEDGGERIHTLFDGGRVLRRLSFPQSKADPKVDALIHSTHIDMVSEIELLYQISVRIKTVRHAPSLLSQGRLFVKWRLLDEAVSELELARHIAPKNREVLAALSEAYRLRGGLKEALDILAPGLNDGLESALFWCQKGHIAILQKQWRAAQQCFVSALKVNPLHIESFLRSAEGYLLSHEGQGENGKRDRLVEKAREQIGRAIHNSTFPIHRAEEALRLLHQQRVQQVLALLTVLLEEKPWALPVDRYDRFYLDYLYGEQGRDAQRIQGYIRDLETAVRQYPPNGELHNRLGVAYMLQCRALFSHAIHEFQKALAINPALMRAKRNLQLVKNDAKGFLILLRALLK